MRITDLKDSRIAILGSERSGMGAAALLRQAGANVLVSELDPNRFNAEKRQRLAEIQAEFEFGYHSPDVLESDFVVVSPGVPDSADIMVKLRESSIPIYSEVEVTSWFIQDPIIAVTGSNGKTTTVNLIHHLLKTAGVNSYLGGNVGQAISEVYLLSEQEGGVDRVFVLEVSSFQLDHIKHFKPSVAVVLNLSPDHLDRYPSLDAYYSSKLRIFENQTDTDVAVLNQDDALLMERYSGAGVQRTFSLHTPGYVSLTRDGMISIETQDQTRPILPRDRFPIPGPHNLSNALAAIAAVQDNIADQALLVKGLTSFQAVPHRLEYLGDVRGMQIFNDSKATNVDSTRVALESFEESVWIILGGKDKGGDFSQLEALLSQRAAGILLIGEASEIIASQLNPDLPLQKLETLDRALEYALEHGQAGDIVLLSPACASFDQYDGFEERGDHLRTLVREHGQ